MRKINRDDNTIDGMKMNIFCRNTSVVYRSKNDACDIKTYKGGEHCCHHEMRILDEGQILQEKFNEEVSSGKYKYFWQYFSIVSQTEMCVLKFVLEICKLKLHLECVC